jgi:hypothetical protein
VIEGAAARESAMPGTDEEFVEVKEEPKVKVVAKKRAVSSAETEAAGAGEGESEAAKAKPTARPKAKPAAGRGKKAGSE